jgi:hypothetical protein
MALTKEAIIHYFQYRVHIQCPEIAFSTTSSGFSNSRIHLSSRRALDHQSNLPSQGSRSHKTLTSHPTSQRLVTNSLWDGAIAEANPTTVPRSSFPSSQHSLPVRRTFAPATARYEGLGRARREPFFHHLSRDLQADQGGSLSFAVYLAGFKKAYKALHRPVSPFHQQAGTVLFKRLHHILTPTSSLPSVTSLDQNAFCHLSFHSRFSRRHRLWFSHPGRRT